MLQLVLSETASKKLKELIERPDPDTGKAVGNAEDTYVRVFVAGGGCSGFRYGMALDHNVHEGDEVIQHDGIKVVVDAMSKEFVDGSSVDYVESVQGSGFAITNPNNVSTCGCGQSFNRKGEGDPDESGGHHGHEGHAHEA
jgi:iron-sulfur cluster assembly accessory protein